MGLYNVSPTFTTGLHTETSHLQDSATDNPRTKTWGIPRQGYSYSENTDLNQIDILGGNDTPDILGDNDESPLRNYQPDVHRQNIVNSLKHGATGWCLMTNNSMLFSDLQ